MEYLTTKNKEISYLNQKLTWLPDVMVLRQVHIDHYKCISPTLTINIIITANDLSSQQY